MRNDVKKAVGTEEKPKKKDPMRIVRPIKVEIKMIGRTKEEDAAARKRIMELSVMVQEATNYAWRQFELWHEQNESYIVIRQFQADWIEYKRALAAIELAVDVKGLTKKERNEIKASMIAGLVKPSCNLKAIPSELANKIYHGVTERWPDLHTKVVTLTLRRWSQLVNALKASKGSFAGWHAIVMYRQQVPSSIHPLPLCFENAKSGNSNSKLLLPESDAEHHRLKVSLSREDVGKKVKSSVTFDCQIWDKGKQMSSRRQTLKKIATGEYQMLGSQMFFKDGKLFAAITFELPQQKPTLGNGVALIGPGRNKPLLMRTAGANRNRWVLGDGRVVGEVRRRLMCQRMGRKSAYRESFTSNSRGHGRVRGIEKVTKLSRRWRDFVVTYNRNMAAAIVSECLRSGIGLIKISRPKKNTRFLSNVGNDSRFDVTSWDWYGLEKRIMDKCNEFGIVVESRPQLPRRRLVNGVLVKADDLRSQRASDESESASVESTAIAKT